VFLLSIYSNTVLEIFEQDMITNDAAARLHAKESETQLEHTIFKICLQCHYNTLKPLDCSPAKCCGLGYRCPKCQKSSFVTVCTVCRFESSAECPLTALLTRRPKVVHERRGRERYHRGEAGDARDASTTPAPNPRRLKPFQNRALGGPIAKKHCQDILKQFKQNGNKVHTAPQTKCRSQTEGPQRSHTIRNLHLSRCPHGSRNPQN
jgi:hypothetical protein